jgi:hypothetical protein
MHNSSGSFSFGATSTGGVESTFFNCVTTAADHDVFLEN